MKHEDFKPSHNISDNLNEDIDNFIRKHNELKDNIRNYNRFYNQLRSQIFKAIIKHKIEYARNISFWNKRINSLQIKKKNYTILLGSITKDFKNIRKPQIDGELSNQIHCLELDIKKVKNEIEKFEGIIKSVPLDINQEDEIITKIDDLQKKKSQLSSKMREKERKQKNSLENSHYYITLNKIKYLKTNLDYIQIQLKKWRDKRKKNHLQILILYRKLNDLSINRSKLDNQFDEITFSNEKIKNYFNEILNNGKEALEEEISPISEDERRKEKKKNNWLLMQKHKHKKLAIAIEKKKMGKKLDFYELKLILENSKKL